MAQPDKQARKTDKATEKAARPPEVDEAEVEADEVEAPAVTETTEVVVTTETTDPAA